MGTLTSMENSEASNSVWERRPLGKSGLTVAPIGLGGMPMSLDGRPPEEVSIRVIHAALDAGMDLIDTANVYCRDDHDIGHNERLIALALRDRPDRSKIIVATKGGLTRPGGRWERDGNPARLKLACERSLKALGVDSITVYQLHAPDERYPYTDIIGALAQLRAEGKIQHVGLSNVSVAQIRQAEAIVPIVSVQNRCGPLDPAPFRDGVVKHCEAQQIAMLAYSPVGGGGGKARIADHRVLKAVGQKHSVSPFQVALAWLLAKSPAVIPIPGASKVHSAVDSAAAMQLKLGADDMRELDAAFRV